MDGPTRKIVTCPSCHGRKTLSFIQAPEPIYRREPPSRVVMLRPIEGTCATCKGAGVVFRAPAGKETP